MVKSKTTTLKADAKGSTKKKSKESTDVLKQMKADAKGSTKKKSKESTDVLKQIQSKPPQSQPPVQIQAQALETQQAPLNHSHQQENGKNDISTSISSKKKRNKKLMVSGSSNWALLCSELKTNPLKRKSHVDKSDEEITENEEPMPKVPKPDVWFDNVDETLLEIPQEPTIHAPTASNSLVKDDSFTGKTKCIGMDCEMVGIGKDREESILARVSLVNIYGNCLYDKYVLPREKVTDYRTAVSGVTKKILDEKGEPFLKVQKEVSDIIQGGILVGHALHNDLKVLFLGHPHKNIRDTVVYKPFRDLFKGQRPSLKRLTEKVLGVKVQDGAHSSVEDAQAAMRLYTMHKKKWEMEVKSLGRIKRKKKSKQKKKESKQKKD